MDNQILKNSGYINIQLHCVNYMSIGNFWQKTFGGKDSIALATTLEYQTGVERIEATSVQDVRVVKTDHNYNLGLQRNIAVKIPANFHRWLRSYSRTPDHSRNWKQVMPLLSAANPNPIPSVMAS